MQSRLGGYTLSGVIKIALDAMGGDNAPASVIDGAGGYQAYDEAIRTSAEAALAQDDDMHSSMDDAEADAAVRLATGDEE